MQFFHRGCHYIHFPPFFLQKDSRYLEVKDIESKEEERSKKQYPFERIATCLLEKLSVFIVYGQDRQICCGGHFQSQPCLNVSTNDGLNPLSVPVFF